MVRVRWYLCELGPGGSEIVRVTGESENTRRPMGKLKANDYGLFDMCGNVVSVSSRDDVFADSHFLPTER